MGSLFHFQVSPGELILRGSLIYWFLFFILRFVLRRDAGSLGLADILMIVLIADASQNGMSGEYKSVGEGMILVGTIVAWNYFFDWMSYRYRWFARFSEPRVVPLVRHGSVLGENLRREMLTLDELKSQLREGGVESIRDVKHARLESDGHISIIKYAPSELQPKVKHVPGAG